MLRFRNIAWASACVLASLSIARAQSPFEAPQAQPVRVTATPGMALGQPIGVSQDQQLESLRQDVKNPPPVYKTPPPKVQES